METRRVSEMVLRPILACRTPSLAQCPTFTGPATALADVQARNERHLKGQALGFTDRCHVYGRILGIWLAYIYSPRHHSTLVYDISLCLIPLKVIFNSLSLVLVSTAFLLLSAIIRDGPSR